MTELIDGTLNQLRAANPVSVATWMVLEASGNFCSRGGRFGTHSSNENMTPIY